MDPALFLKLEEKLNPSLNRLKEGKSDDHDIFPSLLGALLSYSKNIQEVVEQTAPLLQQESERLRKEIDAVSGRFPELMVRQEAIIDEMKESLRQEAAQIREKIEVAVVSSALLEEVQKNVKNLHQEIVQLGKKMETTTNSTLLLGETQRSFSETIKGAIQRDVEALHKQIETVVEKVAHIEETQKAISEKTPRKLTTLQVISIFQLFVILCLVALSFFK